MAAIFGSVNLDIDEFTFIREPYELLGGDYTAGYLTQQRYGDALETLAKSYYFYWKYRPLFSPIVSPNDQEMFRKEEVEFGYVRPEPVASTDENARALYERRLIVPEPDRFYSHGAGKPLLSAVLSIPQLALVQAVAPADLLHYQFTYNYHPIFILTRLVQLLAGLFTLCIVYRILVRELDEERAILGAAVFLFFPMTIKYFPNLHHDALLPPFLVLSVYWFYERSYVRGGVALGLALAVKNVAIFLIPVLLAAIVIDFWMSRASASAAPRKDPLDGAVHFGVQLRGIAITMAVSLVCLLPFASPVAYANELLTPITQRVTDDRGEDVSQYTLSERLSAPEQDPAASVVRPEIQLARSLLRLGTNDFFLLAIAILVFWSKPRSRFVQMAFLFLLVSAPYGVVFGYNMSYRSLQFVPFFAIVCAYLAPRRALLALIATLAVVDVLYCLDPITTDPWHRPVNRQALLDGTGGEALPHASAIATPGLQARRRGSRL